MKSLLSFLALVAVVMLMFAGEHWIDAHTRFQTFEGGLRFMWITVAICTAYLIIHGIVFGYRKRRRQP